MRNLSGITLLELSIVLAVIGLLASGVNLASDLIKSGKVAKDIATIKAYSNAVADFQDKYNSLPGDFSQAVAVLGASENGNGNGIIAESNSGIGSFPLWEDNTIGTNEIPLVFQQLSLAGLISGSFDGSKSSVGVVLGTNFPEIRPNRGFMIYSDVNGKLNIYIGITSGDAGSAGNISYQFTYTPLEAYNIDRKMDDGLATNGFVTAQGSGPGTSIFLPGGGIAYIASDPFSGGSNSGCVDNNVVISARNYLLTDTSQYCNLNIKL
jgi:prepilin-type N-terminal cleavage/methylation domain-containing protein